MFLSIKWKSLGFLSLILVFSSLTWVAVSAYQNSQYLKVSLQNSQFQYQQIFNDLIQDNSIKLSQFAQLIARSDEFFSLKQPYSVLATNSYLSKKIFDWNINLGVDYVAVFDQKKNLIADANISITENNSKDFYRDLEPILGNLSFEKTQGFIRCNQECVLYVFEPVVNSDGQNSLMLIGQNMSEIVLRYSRLSGADLGVLLTDKEGRKQVWTVSNHEKILPILLEKYVSVSSKTALPSNVFGLQISEHFFYSLDLSSYKVIGQVADLIVIYQEKQSIQRYQDEIFGGLVTSVVILLLALTALFLIVINPVRRIAEIEKAQSFLPKGEFDAALESLSNKKPAIADELTLLESSTVAMANELKELNKEVEDSHLELLQQLTILSRSQAFLKRLFDNANIFIVTISKDFSIRSSNKFFEANFQLTREQSFTDLLANSYEKNQYKVNSVELFEQKIDDFHQEAQMLSANDGNVIVVWNHSMVVDEFGNNVLLSIGVDITQRKADEKALHWLANHDSLTGLANRRAFKENLHERLFASEAGAVVFVDVNKFKNINDLHGHGLGDKVLIDVGEKLKLSLRECDFIARLAGDEFTIILPGVDRETLPQILQNIWQVFVSSNITLNAKQVEYDVSIGAALFPEHGDKDDLIVAHADMAMFHAKRKPDYKWHIFDEKDDSLIEIKRLQELKDIIKNALENELFYQVFQPTISLKDGSISHYESLIRLETLAGEFVSPGDFIPAAEKTGLIYQVDHWVINSLYQKMQSWLGVSANLSIGLNISAPTLQDKNFCKDLIILNEKYAVPPQNIVIELTETAYIDDFYNVKQNLNKLSEYGFSIALDDFGVGFSSFSYLRDLPLTYVKLDGSYVNGIAHNSANIAFVKSVVLMAQEYQMKTIAEFVETQEDLEILVSLGVDFAQGYLIGKPMQELLSQDEIIEKQSLVLKV